MISEHPVYNKIKKPNLDSIAKKAGILYLLLVPFGIFGIMYIPSFLLVEGDLIKTSHNILENEFLFRLSIISSFCTQLIYLFLVLKFYQLFKKVDKNLAFIMLVFVLIAIPIAMFNEINMFMVLLLIQDLEQFQSMILLFLNLHQYGVLLAQVFWGLWLFPLGCLIIKSAFIPRVIGVLILIAGSGYVVDSLLGFIFPNFVVTLSEFTFVGEVILPLWLIVKGINLSK